MEVNLPKDVDVEKGGCDEGGKGGGRFGCPEPATLTWEGVRLTAKDSKGNEKVILHDVSGFVLPRHMLAIMGPSGSGKTTLLDALAGRVAKNVHISGKVLLNGHVSNLSYGRSSYVTQDEVLIGVLSVRETVLFAALLRLPASMSRADKEQRVDSVISEMGLSEAQHTKIGNWYMKGISGGQRRRLAIACELVTQPTLMFLDEPTSGLDAASAYFVMDTVRTLALHNRTILTVIHQPSSEVFELFDQLALLSNGNVVYFGPAKEALNMFEAAGLPCPAMRSATDHFLHVINQDFKGAAHSGDVERNRSALIERYTTALLPDVMRTVQEQSAIVGKEYVGQTNEASYLYQTAVLTWRSLLNNWRNVGVFWLRLAMYLILCICIGTIYYSLDSSWKDTYSFASMLFFCVAFLTFMSISGFPAFVEDMMVFVRERLNGYYQVSSFVISNTLASVPFIFGIALSSAAVVYWLVGLNDEGDRFPFFFMQLFASLLVVESLMMAIAAIVPHYLMGIAAGAGIMGMFMLVCGFFQPTGSIPKPVWLYPLHFIAYHTYSFAGFMHNQFDGTTGWGCPCADQPGGCPGPCTVTGNEVLDFWLSGRTATLNKWVDFLILMVMCVGYRTIFWMLLRVKEWMATH